jgi:exodeoxyribonuclease-3
VFRLVTLNLNGIRSAASKGFVEWAQSRVPIVWGCRRSRPRHGHLAGRYDHIDGLSGHFHLRRRRATQALGLYTRKRPSAM